MTGEMEALLVKAGRKTKNILSKKLAYETFETIFVPDYIYDVGP